MIQIQDTIKLLSYEITNKKQKKRKDERKNKCKEKEE